MLFLNNKRSWILCGITLLAAAAAFPSLPAQIPVHWSGSAADGFAGKWAVFSLPGPAGRDPACKPASWVNTRSSVGK